MIQNFPSARLGPQKPSVREQVIATIPQERNNTVLEVVMVQRTVGSPEVELRTMIWGDGLGWYRQNTLILDQTGARKLLSALSSVRRRLEPARAARHANQDEGKVIPFPDRQTSATEAAEATALLA
jgi:hypothetical protein